MDWIKLESEDLECALNKPQLEILKAQILRSPARDVARDVLDSVIARVRAEIAASGLNMLDTDHSRIPPELRECVLRLAVEALQLRVPNMELTAAQTKHADFARQTLIRVATGELPISRPLVAIRLSSPKRGFFGKSANRVATRKSLENL